MGETGHMAEEVRPPPEGGQPWDTRCSRDAAPLALQTGRPRERRPPAEQRGDPTPLLPQQRLLGLLPGPASAVHAHQ